MTQASSADSVRCVRCKVEGRVQGVFFRASTREKAERLNLVGSARNLEDGSVEVVAQGDPDAVAELIAWLWEGSKLSNVSAVAIEDMEPVRTLQGFSTG